MSRDSDSDSGWTTDAIDKATEKLRTELEKEESESSGKKESALEDAKEYVDKIEQKLKRK